MPAENADRSADDTPEDLKGRVRHGLNDDESGRGHGRGRLLSPPVGRGRRSRRTGLAAPLVVVIGTVAGMLTGCGAGGGHDLGHVHALGVDPADGALYAASHHGLFRIQDGADPQRIGTGSQDLMGFFIVGAGHYLGSGRPAPGENQPANLGLLESTDAGLTWQPVSLSGEVDFHAIDVKQGSVYGYDSQTQQIMVSSDRRAWERRASLQLADLAVSPNDPQFILATTAQGLVHSADGGRTFVVVNSAPTLQLVDWSIENLIMGVGPTGIVGASSDHGATWTKLGTVAGVPAALATNGPQEVYVATDLGIYASTDGGRTFHLRHSMKPS